MKYLKLTNTPECLKMAECLLNSSCESGMLKSGTLLGVNKMFAVTHNGGVIHGFWRDEILLPLETLKINPYKCMEHEIVVTAPYIVPPATVKPIPPAAVGRIHYCNLSKYSPSRKKECGIENCVNVFLDDIVLDLTNLPSGASIIEEKDKN